MGIDFASVAEGWIEKEAQAQRALASYAADRAHRNKDARRGFLVSNFQISSCAAQAWSQQNEDDERCHPDTKAGPPILEQILVVAEISSCCRKQKKMRNFRRIRKSQARLGISR